MKEWIHRLGATTHGQGTDVGLLMLRLGTGLLMLFAHGMPKLLGFGDKAAVFPDPLGLGSPLSLALAVFAEVFCAALIALGLFTRLAAVPLVITMLVAAFIIHADDPFRKMEFALVYAIPFLTLAFSGAGRFSLDARFFGKN